MLFRSACTDQPTRKASLWQAKIGRPFGKEFKSQSCTARRAVSAQFRVHAFCLTDPSQVVQEALVSLRKNHVDRFTLLLAAPSQAHELQVHQDGAETEIDRNTLSHLAGILDIGSRRLLPENLLRRCQAVSSIQISPNLHLQRTLVTAKSGEEGILLWRLEKGIGGIWKIVSIDHEKALPDPLPSEPHPRLSPETVISAMSKWCAANVIWRAAQFLNTTGDRREKEAALHQMIHVNKDLLHLCQPQKALDIAQSQLLNRQTMTLLTYLQHCGVDDPCPVDQPCAFLWTLCLNDNGCWAVKTIESVKRTTSARAL